MLHLTPHYTLDFAWHYATHHSSPHSSHHTTHFYTTHYTSHRSAPRRAAPRHITLCITPQYTPHYSPQYTPQYKSCTPFELYNLFVLQTVNPFNAGMIYPNPSDNNIIFTQMRTQDLAPSWLSESRQPDRTEYLVLGLHKLDNPLFNVPKLYPCWDTVGNVTSGEIYMFRYCRLRYFTN